MYYDEMYPSEKCTQTSLNRYLASILVERSGQVKYGGIRRSSAWPHPPCDGALFASVWSSPWQTPGRPCPYLSERTSSDAIMKSVDASSAWSSPLDLDKKASGGRDHPEGHMPNEVQLTVTNNAGDLSEASLAEYQVIRHIVMQSVTGGYWS